MKATKVTIGRRLKRARQLASYPSQTAACAGLTISQRALSDYETGSKAPGSLALGILADRYGVTCDWLLGRA